MGILVFESGKEKNKRMRLDHYPVTIGRDPANTITIDDDEVSRFHLRIKKRGKNYILEDLDSKNGTYLNTDKIINTLIKNGDTILIGNSQFSFATTTPGIVLSQESSHSDFGIVESTDADSSLSLTSLADSKYSHERFRISTLAPLIQHSTEIKTKIYDHFENTIAVSHADEAGQRLLKAIGLLSPRLEMAGFFSYRESTMNLEVIATRSFDNTDRKITVSRRGLEDALARKQAIHLSLKDSNSHVEELNNLYIVPIESNGRICFFLHLEYRPEAGAIPQDEIAAIGSLASKSAPFFENMLLRGEINSWTVGMVETMVATIEAKDTYTLGHSERVCKYAIAMADELRINAEVKKLLMVSSLCHDIGKIGVPDAILKKASLLSAEEYKEIQLHPVIGADIIEKMPNAKKIMSGVKYHHEKWDGTGYPDGLLGEEIPFFARIVAIADVFDAMVSGRSYSGFMDESDAVQKLNEEIDLFDPEIVKAFNKAWNSGTLTLKTSTLGKAE